jgi:hypothetical protein
LAVLVAVHTQLLAPATPLTVALQPLQVLASGLLPPIETSGVFPVCEQIPPTARTGGKHAREFNGRGFFVEEVGAMARKKKAKEHPQETVDISTVSLTDDRGERKPTKEVQQLTEEQDRELVHLEGKVVSSEDDRLNALATIKAKKLYRKYGRTWEDYCWWRFGYSRSYLYEMQKFRHRKAELLSQFGSDTTVARVCQNLNINDTKVLEPLMHSPEALAAALKATQKQWEESGHKRKPASILKAEVSWWRNYLAAKRDDPDLTPEKYHESVEKQHEEKREKKGKEARRKATELPPVPVRITFRGYLALAPHNLPADVIILMLKARAAVLTDVMVVSVPTIGQFDVANVVDVTVESVEITDAP